MRCIRSDYGASQALLTHAIVPLTVAPLFADDVAAEPAVAAAVAGGGGSGGKGIGCASATLASASASTSASYASSCSRASPLNGVGDASALATVHGKACSVCVEARLSRSTRVRISRNTPTSAASPWSSDVNEASMRQVLLTVLSTQAKSVGVATVLLARGSSDDDSVGLNSVSKSYVTSLRGSH